MTIAQFNKLSSSDKNQHLFSCCGSTAWVKGMLEILPVENLTDLLDHAEEIWYDCNPADWLEAFENHTRLGDKEALGNEDMASFGKSEQAKLLTSDEKVVDELIKANKEYEEIFGYMFISYAPGKSAAMLLKELKERLNNDPREEIKIAAAEQDKITKGRLTKLFAQITARSKV